MGRRQFVWCIGLQEELDMRRPRRVLWLRRLICMVVGHGPWRKCPGHKWSEERHRLCQRCDFEETLPGEPKAPPGAAGMQNAAGAA